MISQKLVRDMLPKVKICGITNLEDALACARAGAFALGFIFYPRSPRAIDPQKAAGIIKQLPPCILTVGVFVNEPHDKIHAIVSETNISVIQLSGDEEPSDCTGLGLAVWKSFRITDRSQVPSISRYVIDAAMLDGASGGSYGGSGRTADVSIAREMKKYHSLILAGGLNPANIVDAVKNVQPFAVDVNSGVELAPGKKDHKKVLHLFKQLKTLGV